MTWTYIPQLLTSTATVASLMKVRLVIGDTDSTRPQLQDEEIYFVLSAQSIINYAAADCADLLSAKYAFQVNTENSLLRISAAARHKHYADLAKRLRSAGPGVTPGGEGAGSVLATGYAGGISDTANQSLRDDADNILAPASVGQDDFPDVQDNPADYFGEG
jgi:hypothetical protein